MEKEKETLNSIAQAIFDKKGSNIIALDVREFSSLTDYFVIAEGGVERHIAALSREIKAKMAEAGYHPLYAEGTKQNDWIVLDYGNIIVHLLLPEMREKYALEELWKEAKIVDLEIVV